MKSLMYRLWVYFRRGHGTYLALGISVLNFITIQYRLMIEQSPLKNIFTDPILFAIVFGSLYALASALIGWWDVRKGSLGAEMELSVIANPYTHDTAQFNLELCKALNKIGVETTEAEKIMERWL